MELQGYRIGSKLYSGKRSDVYRGVRDDNKPVVIKTLKSEYPTHLELLTFCNQFDIIKPLDLRGSVNQYDLIKHLNGFVIIMEDMGAISLREAVKNTIIDVELFLKIAIRLADAIGEIHLHNIIHKDINPNNIISTPDFETIKIIDFSIASKLSEEKQTVISPNQLEGTLLYISPEQTGRMNRGIDYRTDLYSLGVTLYELITGVLPFEASDALGLIHLHIAQNPVAPHDRSEAIPRSVSNIILKLLSKTAEERYVCAYGLKADLERCLDQLHHQHQIHEFDLGQRDYSDKLRLVDKLYGREDEIRILLETFQRVSHGATEMILVSGYSGIGKSALINEIHKPILAQRGYFVSGKFDQFKRNIPYSAIIQAFQALVQQLLTESDEKIAYFKKRLLASLGQNGQIIIDVIPEVEFIIGPQEATYMLGPVETQNRFNLVFQEFVNVFAQEQHPLALFLDDLQWADSGTLNLVKLFLANTGNHNLLLIGSYRNNEVDETHPLMYMLDEIRKFNKTWKTIEIQPLRDVHVTELLADALKLSKEEVDSLSQLVMKKTLGNPFFVKEFLKSLYQEQVLQFDHSRLRWGWNEVAIYSLGITENVVDLMSTKILKQPRNTQELLKLGACIGNRFSLKILSIVSEMTTEEASNRLWPAVLDGLLLCENKYLHNNVESVFSFPHDKVQQAAFALVEDSQRNPMHLRVGQLLLEQSSEKEREDSLFEIVNHLNKGIDLIQNQGERERLSELNLQAGRKAKESAAYVQGLSYLKIGISLLDIDPWGNQYTLTLSLYDEAAECAYLATEYVEMERLAQNILTNVSSVPDKINIYEIRIHTYTAQNKLKEAVDIGLELLAIMGIRFPKKVRKYHVLVGLIVTQIVLMGKKADDLLDLPRMTDQKMLACIRILGAIASPAYLGRPELLPLIIFLMVSSAVKYGNHEMSPYNYAGFGLILCSIGLIDQGYQFGMMALKLLGKLDIKQQEPRTIFIVNTFVRQWKDPARETLEPGFLAYQKSLEIGDLEFASFSLMNWNYRSFHVGIHLDSQEKETAKYLKILQNMKQETQFQAVRLYHQAMLNLCHDIDEPWKLVGDSYDEKIMLPIHEAANDRMLLSYYYICRMILDYIFGQTTQGIMDANKGEPFLDGVTSDYSIPVFYFYDALIRARAMRHVIGFASKQREIRKIKANIKKFKSWARFAPTNNAHKLNLMEAELARLRGQTKQAILLYDQAILLAKKNEYIHEVAVANECASQFFMDCGFESIAKLYMFEAYYYYQMWGAKSKAKLLEKAYSFLLIQPMTMVPAMEHSQSGATMVASGVTLNLDINTVVKASQALSGEIILKQLLEKMMNIVIECAGAERGVLIFEEKGQYLIKAEGSLDTKTLNVLQNIPIETVDNLSLSIIKYTIRTNESIVLTEALKEKLFLDDMYLAKNSIRSILCTPILHQGKLIAVLYLENKLAEGAFSSDRLEMLRHLSSQIAISVTNATMYETVEFQNIELKKALQAKEELLAIKKELELAAKIQESILPRSFPVIEGLWVYAKYLPMTEIGGDYYDFMLSTDGKLTSIIADVSGHGLTAAMVGSMAKLAYIMDAKLTSSPKHILQSMNANLFDQFQGKYLTAMVISIDVREKKLALSNAGHLPLIIVRNNEVIELTTDRGFPIGWMEENPLAEVNLDLHVGDRILLYTDCILETRNLVKEQFGKDNFYRFLTRHRHTEPSILVDSLINELRLWTTTHVLDDDFTIVVFDVK